MVDVIIRNLDEIWSNLKDLQGTVSKSVAGMYEMIYLTDIQITVGKSQKDSVYYLYPGIIQTCKQWQQCINHITIFPKSCLGHITLYIDKNKTIHPSLNKYLVNCKNQNCRYKSCIYVGVDFNKFLQIVKIVEKDQGYKRIPEDPNILIGLYQLDMENVITAFDTFIGYVTHQNARPQFNSLEPESCLMSPSHEEEDKELLSELLSFCEVKQSGSGSLRNYKEKIKNPLTGRYIYSSGKTAKKLIKMLI